MTYIEFYSKNAIENICSCLAEPPEKVYILGDKKSTIEKKCKIYSEILLNRGFKVEFIAKSVNKNILSNIVSAISEILEKENLCSIDVTGGDDMCLVAVGIVKERFCDKNIQIHRFNIYNDRVIDCDEDGNIISTQPLPKLSVKENIQIYGGNIVETQANETLSKWQLTEDFCQDLEYLWDICISSAKNIWNIQCTFFALAESLSCEEDSLTTTLSISDIKSNLQRQNKKYDINTYLIKALTNVGFIKIYEKDDLLHINYKSLQIKKCLLNPGQLLETYIYYLATISKNDDGTSTYNDVLTGVSIDWDGKINNCEDVFDTKNEIDVIIIHNMLPIFVSCKNGGVTSDELYKLSVVSRRFGGKYAKSVLIVTDFVSDNIAEAMIQRGADMGIKVIELRQITDTKLRNIIKNLWLN